MDTKSKNYRKIYHNLAALFAVLGAITIGISASVLVVLNFTADDLMWRMNSDKVPPIHYHDTLFWALLIIGIVVTIVAAVFMTIFAGDKGEDGKIKKKFVDKALTEIWVVTLSCAVTFAVMSCYVYIGYIQDKVLQANSKVIPKSIAAEMFSEGYYNTPFLGFTGPKWVILALGISGMVACILVGAYSYEKLVIKFKTRSFLKDTVLGKIIIHIVSAGQQNKKLYWAALFIIIAAALLMTRVPGAILVIALAIYFVPKFFKKYDMIRSGIREVKNGNLKYKIPAEGKSELDDLARDINQIAEATDIAIENELKTQRMKADLISNVSHDIKTPLTSIITYVDLLKTEGLDSENAPNYLNVVDEKAQRLRQLTEDLFEAAKASSGAMPVNLEEINMASMLDQTLAETEGMLAEKNLDVITSITNSGAMVMADGQLLWRVFENLLGNVSKYALEGSRVYVDLTEQGEWYKLEIKNISRDRLNISAEELMERFKRGDASRTTEGSGLGLAISKDLVDLMGGHFDIFIQGDLFMAVVHLKKTVAPVEEEPPRPWMFGSENEKTKPEPEVKEEQASSQGNSSQNNASQGNDDLKAFYEKYAEEQARKEQDSQEPGDGNN